jgi:hypothetical protein
VTIAKEIGWSVALPISAEGELIGFMSGTDEYITWMLADDEDHTILATDPDDWN